MKIFIICSKHHYGKVPEIKNSLELDGHCVTIPNSFEDPMKELRLLEEDAEAHAGWVANSWDESESKIKLNDAVLVLNFEKKGILNYVGGATFTEIFMAYRQKRKIFFYNPLPNCSFTDELKGMQPIILNGDLSKIR